MVEQLGAIKYVLGSYLGLSIADLISRVNHDSVWAFAAGLIGSGEGGPWMTVPHLLVLAVVIILIR